MQRPYVQLNPLIIHNPKANNGKLKSLLNPFRERNFPIVTTESANEATQIVQGRYDEFDAFIAAGGDGTVNEVGRALIGKEKPMGIIPMGSGNGLVNEVGKISIDSLINNNYKEISIDTLDINNVPFLNVAGIGFEAAVAKKFSQKKTRGLLSYVAVTISHFLQYKPISVVYHCNGSEFSQNLFSLTVANSRQYGNNVIISPNSKIDDGVFEVCAVQKFPAIYGAIFSYRLFNGSVSKSRFYKSLPCNSFSISDDSELLWNLDGEPKKLKGPFTISIHPKSLNILCDEH